MMDEYHSAGRDPTGHHSDGIGLTSPKAREHLAELLVQQGISSTAVLDAIRQVPRHRFISEALADRAYDNTALPIGCGQTISQPYIVAHMIEDMLQEISGKLREVTVLEVGTGCGYQTAVLAALVKQVYSMERNATLISRAQQRLRDLRIHNVCTRHGDGYRGWLNHAPYDGIIVSAVCDTVPAALCKQLAIGARMLIPSKTSDDKQTLLRIQRTGDDSWATKELLPVSFVPLCKGLVQ